MDDSRIADELVMPCLMKNVAHRIEWVECVVLNASATSKISHVIGDNINHQIHAGIVQCRSQRLQVCSRSKVGVHFVDILSPISMISLSISAITCQIFNDWRYPYLFVESVMAP